MPAQRVADRSALRVWFEVPAALARQVRYFNPASQRYEGLARAFPWKVEAAWQLAMSLHITELHGHIYPDRPATRVCLNEL